MKELDSEAAWTAVMTRDRSWDGRIVYAVTSTGVYCRPSCPSRRPRRERVRFFSTPADAAGAGFRPCKRCRPGTVAASAAETAVARAKEYLDAHQAESVSLARLGQAVGMSPWHLQRSFRRLVGLSPREYADAQRADRLRNGLRREASVSRATFEAGFGSSSRVYERAGSMLGMTPGTYRRGGAGLDIRYTTLSSPHGRLLVAVTDRGVCAVTLGDSDPALVRDLTRQFPRARLERVDEGADEWLARLVRRVAARISRPGRAGEDLPLDLQGTAFQWRVWRALMSIPPGETRTYREVARAIGRPDSVRAVAGACAANRVAVVVPCHRVVRSDGSLGGYRWGLPRKERLLADERAASA